MTDRMLPGGSLGPARGGFEIWLNLSVALTLAVPVECWATTPVMVDRPRTCSSFIAEAATRFGVSEARLSAIMRVESGGSAHAVSRAGAMGCMQIMPATWSEVRARYRLGTDAFDTRDNVLAGAAYLREMIDRYDWPGALAAYNAGPSRYVDFLVGSRALPPETRDYVTQIAGVLHEDGTQPHLEQAIEPRPRWTDAPIFVAANNTPSSPLALRSNGRLDTSARATDRTSAIHTLYPQPANGQLFAVHRQ